MIELEKDARNWGMLCHLASFSGWVGVPFGHILGPLIVWLVKRHEHPFVDDQGKEALNFQITWTIYAAISALSMLAFVGFILLPLVLISGFILVIMASTRASSGEPWRYPLTIRFLR